MLKTMNAPSKYTAREIMERAKLVAIAKYGRRTVSEYNDYEGDFTVVDVLDWIQSLSAYEGFHIEAGDESLVAVRKTVKEYTEKDREEAENLLRKRFPDAYEELQEWKKSEFAKEYNKFKKALDESS